MKTNTYGSLGLPPKRALDPYGQDPLAQVFLWGLQTFVYALWIVSFCVVLPMSLFGIIHYMLIDVFLLLASASTFVLIYMYGHTLSTACCCFSVGGGTRLIAALQLSGMAFYLAIESSNIFVSLARGTGFVAVQWAYQLLSAVFIFAGIPFACAGLYGTLYRSEQAVRVFQWWLVFLFVVSVGIGVGNMYKGEDVCAYYLLRGAAECGHARLVELGALLVDFAWQLYCIWIVKSYVEEMQGSKYAGFEVLLYQEDAADRL